MSLDAYLSSNLHGNGKKDLVEVLIQKNRYCALIFRELAETDKKDAILYYHSLPIDVQEYIKYSNLSQNHYENLFEKKWKII